MVRHTYGHYSNKELCFLDDAQEDEFWIEGSPDDTDTYHEDTDTIEGPGLSNVFESE